MNENQWTVFRTLVNVNSAFGKLPVGDLEREFDALHVANPWLLAFDFAAASMSKLIGKETDVFAENRFAIFRRLVNLNRDFTVAESNGSSLDALEQKLATLYGQHPWLLPFGDVAEDIARQVVSNHNLLLRDQDKSRRISVFATAAP